MAGMSVHPTAHGLLVVALAATAAAAAACAHAETNAPEQQPTIVSLALDPIRVGRAGQRD